MSIAPGTHLGAYEILSLIGAGGMGEVYRARDTRLQCDVAVKVLPADFAADPDRRARFEREAQAIAALSHPNILAIHDIGSHAGAAGGAAQMFVVTELLHGETLREKLAGAPGLPPRGASAGSVHGAGAGARAGRRRADRPVRAGRGVLRDADRPTRCSRS